MSKKKQIKRPAKENPIYVPPNLAPVEIKSEPAWEFVWNASRWLVALGVVLSQAVITIGLLVYLAKHCW